MNKAEQRESQKAIAFAATEPYYAANTLATLMRAASRKSFFELEAIMIRCKLRDYMEVVNGCYVAKKPPKDNT